MTSTEVSARKCCFVYPEGCAKIRQTCGVIVIAIATIAILAGVLLVLAQAGYPLEGINSLAHLIAPHHLYLGLALGGILLTLGVVYTVAEARHYAQRTFSPSELDKLNFPSYLSSLDIESSLDNQTFAKVNRDFDPQNQTPSIHAVVVKNDSGETTSYIAFRTSEGAAAHCAILEQQNYRDESELTLSSPIYPISFIMDNLSPKERAVYEKWLPHALRPGFYYAPEPIIIQSHPVYPLAVGGTITSPECNLTFYKTLEQRETARNTYSDFLDVETFTPVIESRMQEVMQQGLPNNEYITFTVTYNGSDYAMVAFGAKGGECFYEYFGTDSEEAHEVRKRWIAHLKLIPAKIDEKTYTAEAARELMDRRAFDAFHLSPSTAPLLPPTYETADFELFKNPTLRIFAIRVHGPEGSGCMYYKTSEARQAHVRMLFGYVSLDDLRKRLWGWESALGLLGEEGLDDKCSQAGDFWRSEVQCNGETLYVAVYHQGGNLRHIYDKDAQNLELRIKNRQRSFKNDKNIQWGEAFRDAWLIDKIVTSPGQYWTEKATPRHIYIYYYDTQDNACKIHWCKPEAVQRFLDEHDLVTNTKMALGAGPCSKAFAIYLLKLDDPNWEEQTHVLGETRYLSPGEYVFWDIRHVQHPHHSGITIVNYKDNDKVDHVLYFRESDAARTLFASGQCKDFINGFERDHDQYLYFKRIVVGILEDKTPLCFTWLNPDNSYISYFTCDGSRFSKRQCVKADAFQLPINHRQFTPEDVLQYEVCPVEVEILEKQVHNPSKGDARWLDKDTGLQPGQYVIRSYLRFYSVILLRAPEDNSRCTIEYYRKESDRYSKRLTALKHAGYADAESLKPAT
jgi:hypothetical protein